MPSYDPGLVRKLRAAGSDWCRAAVFTADEVLAATWEVGVDDLRHFCSTFDNRDAAIANGFQLQEHHFDVHRWHNDYEPMLASGRRGDAVSGEGIALAHIGRAFVLITFTYPIVSALALSQLRDFARAELASFKA
mmetsp:Transcript_4327/g.13074  ORF Transcript_4327/g.13074 Transcript_4327/m.13074 type:complete len:135 (+) Transcript_4327:103-507(+)|eukprot:CAMPEP_0198728972 /NCGR_PEP_ID=MMETSP1475-20131203/12931_1 /TAXON_ID= ORGANISM="Unidentified sp., Strain CCMP1999" /NCGR_SAMPLE_ID=MMETSP1475 /ASSEMBLY_ACC=CAM_ASM_001111 /LENGTH=134 /DNA_ID=CAMNT_0044491485 /DNA_START=64 /DNA_END=468 /DNA_ORIENTATION=-